MSENESKELTKEKIQVYEIIFTMFIKLILVVAGLVAFFIVLFYLVKTDDKISKIVYGCFNTILGGTIFLVYRHYFPDKKKQNTL